MTARAKTGNRQRRYLELIRRFPLRPLRSDEDLDRAIAMVDELTDRLDTLAEEERDYLDVLSDLIERYEDEHVPIPTPSDAELLRYLIEAKGVTQAQVAKDCGIVDSTISAVLAGRRNLNRDHIGKLSRYFHVEPSVFSFAD
jgi:HTH-type transcriptional regulator/antitoxin HigA